MAKAFHAAGYPVAVTGRDTDALAAVAKALPGVVALAADVTDAARATAVVAEVEAAQGPIGVLINNAGLGGGPAGPRPLWEMTVEEWWRVYEVNLKGPMIYSHAVLPAMRAAGSGVIINLGSYIAIRPEATATAYGGSKAALARFTDCLAEEVAENGIQVFCTSPGLVLTDMSRGLPFINDIPPEYFSQPEDIARLALALASGSYGALSGCFLHVTDDLEVIAREAERVLEQRLYKLSLHGLEGLIP
jgi:NAD(P)-dependent dehydrogenase (short-subunit alcohol dehydrogenase family)